MSDLTATNCGCGCENFLPLDHPSSRLLRRMRQYEQRMRKRMRQ